MLYSYIHILFKQRFDILILSKKLLNFLDHPVVRDRIRRQGFQGREARYSGTGGKVFRDRRQGVHGQEARYSRTESGGKVFRNRITRQGI